MSRRVFAISGFAERGTVSSDHNERLDKLTVTKDALLNEVLSHPNAAKAGVDRDGLENALHFIQGLSRDRAPTLRHGPSAEARIDSGDTLSLTDDHFNAHGERVIEGYRKNGPHIERVRVVEERIDGRTTMVTRRMGGR